MLRADSGQTGEVSQLAIGARLREMDDHRATPARWRIRNLNDRIPQVIQLVIQLTSLEHITRRKSSKRVANVEQLLRPSIDSSISCSIDSTATCTSCTAMLPRSKQGKEKARIRSAQVRSLFPSSLPEKHCPLTLLQSPCSFSHHPPLMASGSS